MVDILYTTFGGNPVSFTFRSTAEMTVLEEGADSDDEDDDDNGSTPRTSFPLESFRVVVLLPPRCREDASLQTSSAADGAST